MDTVEACSTVVSSIAFVKPLRSSERNLMTLNALTNDLLNYNGLALCIVKSGRVRSIASRHDVTLFSRNIIVDMVVCHSYNFYSCSNKRLRYSPSLPGPFCIYFLVESER